RSKRDWSSDVCSSDLQRSLTLNHQRINDRIFKSASDISTRLVVGAVITNSVRCEGFQTREAAIQPWAVSHRAREDKAPGGALRRSEERRVGKEGTTR